MNPANNSKLDDLVPMRFQLGQNYPDPFKEKTTIKYCVGFRCRVVLTVAGIDGREMQRIVDQEQEAGTYEVEFFVAMGQAAGGRLEKTYTCRLEAGGFVETKQMHFIRDQAQSTGGRYAD